MFKDKNYFLEPPRRGKSLVERSETIPKTFPQGQSPVGRYRQKW